MVYMETCCTSGIVISNSFRLIFQISFFLFIFNLLAMTKHQTTERKKKSHHALWQLGASIKYVTSKLSLSLSFQLQMETYVERGWIHVGRMQCAIIQTQMQFATANLAFREISEAESVKVLSDYLPWFCKHSEKWFTVLSEGGLWIKTFNLKVKVFYFCNTSGTQQNCNL